MSDPEPPTIDEIVDRLTRPHDVELVDTEQHVTIRRQAPLLEDLGGALAASLSVGRGAQKALHERLTFNVDAADLHRTIEHRVRAWSAAIGLRPSRFATLEGLLAAWWRRVQQISPVDVATYRPKLEQWAQQIEDLVDPPARTTLEQPCPECGVAYMESAEQHGRPLQVVIRQPAERSTVTCRACGHQWHGIDGAKALAARIHPEEKTA